MIKMGHNHLIVLAFYTVIQNCVSISGFQYTHVHRREDSSFKKIQPSIIYSAFILTHELLFLPFTAAMNIMCCLEHEPARYIPLTHAWQKSITEK